jgi:hypothetical protein
MKQKSPIKKKVTTVLSDDLNAEATAIEKKTGLGISDLLRIGLVKVVREVKRTGKVEVEQLDVAIPA